MPTCFVTLSENLPSEAFTDSLRLSLRQHVAEGLDSGARSLDETHIVLRVLSGSRRDMLGDVEVEIFSQFFLRRFFDRDRRAERISRALTKELGVDVATWIVMGVVGYSRVTDAGDAFFSD